ncbi:class I SAM-dependent methyltransferase [Puia sp.]|jgi:ubiquinone/menaquinone biosynthesis C-methylase UbiE|uniref:class I SAM-dependent methyltransferase n=1 Tax=Puia sp. TaxID=2045100 RepID=UPI002F3F07D9
MEPQLEQIREQQKASWNKFSGGWRKWNAFTMDFLQPTGDEIIRCLAPKAGDQVLDIASGTGEPGLTIAALVKQGKVTLTDLSEDMLAVARDQAASKGIRNIDTIVCDVCELPFEDASFDAVSCRFGFMFFPDMALAAREMVRVLKPGGRLATAVWGSPEKNPWVTIIMGVINRTMQLPPPPPGAPGMFRCAAPGLLAGLFEQAGLKNTTEKEITGKLECGSPETYWDLHTEVGAPIVAAMSKADEKTREIIKKETFTLLQQKFPGNTAIDYAATVICGQK